MPPVRRKRPERTEEPEKEKAASRVTLKIVNQELAKQGHNARLEKGDGYFYFRTGEAAGWLDRTVRVPTLGSLTLGQWLDAFRSLKKKNAELWKPGSGTGRNSKPKPSGM